MLGMQALAGQMWQAQSTSSNIELNQQLPHILASVVGTMGQNLMASPNGAQFTPGPPFTPPQQFQQRPLPAPPQQSQPPPPPPQFPQQQFPQQQFPQQQFQQQQFPQQQLLQPPPPQQQQQFQQPALPAPEQQTAPAPGT
jgi:hypothetical protein